MKVPEKESCRSCVSLLPCIELGNRGIFSVARGLNKVKLLYKSVSERSVWICPIQVICPSGMISQPIGCFFFLKQISPQLRT